jgi:ectoine hydroxylase-related dioxygenase (phytanoyl-CoA dioxygenase family)
MTTQKPPSAGIPRYGVREQNAVSCPQDIAIEKLRLLGHAIVPSGYSAEQLAVMSHAFDSARNKLFDRYGEEHLRAIDEHNTIRAPLSIDRTFLDMACNPVVLDVVQRIIGGVVVLNQQNGIINPPNGERYNQSSYHRDLPYQHFVSTRPLAINALFCVDEFTLDNGATYVLPGSHKVEAFPSDEVIRDVQIQVAAPAGSFILLDCMTYHSGAMNRTAKPRRAVNHVYSIPIIKPQISFPDILGPDYTEDQETRKLLGYNYQVPTSLAQYYKRHPA